MADGQGERRRQVMRQVDDSLSDFCVPWLRVCVRCAREGTPCDVRQRNSAPYSYYSIATTGRDKPWRNGGRFTAPLHAREPKYFRNVDVEAPGAQLLVSTRVITVYVTSAARSLGLAARVAAGLCVLSSD